MNTVLSVPSGTTEFLNFSDALHYLRWGERVSRRAWKGTKTIRVKYGQKPRLISSTRYSDSLWVPDSACLLAEDWYVVNPDD